MAPPAHPNSSASWKAWAESPALREIPLSTFESKQSSILTQRGIYVDVAALPPPGVSDYRVYADVISLATKLVIDLEEPKTAVLAARVFTAAAPVTIEFIPAKNEASMFVLYGMTRDQPISYTVRGTQHSGKLEWNAQATGLQIFFEGATDSPTIAAADAYDDILDSVTFAASLATQLRIASALFFSQPAVALAQSCFIVRATHELAGLGVLNLQAASLGRQIAAHALTGPDMNYAPVLTFATYHDEVKELVNTAGLFEKEYERFSDKALEMAKRQEGLEQGIQHAGDVQAARKTWTTALLEKYHSACGIVESLNATMSVDNLDLGAAESVFRTGIETYKREMKLQAAIQIIEAVIEVTVSIGMACMGEPSIPPIGPAVKAVEGAAEAAGEGAKIAKDTLEKVFCCLESVYKLYPTIKDAVSSLEETEDETSSALKKMDTVTGDDTDASGIVSTAAWDRWILDSDAQIQFAVDNKIAGASEYRLALRKHAINGKALVLAQCEAIKAGHEYVHSKLDLAVAKHDLVSLGELKDKWQTDEGLQEKVAMQMYDRFMTVRTCIVMQMRNLLWAYKYAALRDSIVQLGLQKSTAEYQDDLSTIQHEFNNYKEEYPYGFSSLTPRALTTKTLPAPFRQKFLSALQNAQPASFTLVPSLGGSDPDNLAGPFTGGQHFRIVGMSVLLKGAVPKNPDTSSSDEAAFRIMISTSGVYSDVGEAGKVLQFTTPPVVKKPFEYDIDSDGKMVARKDSFAQLGTGEAKEYAAPTPFTTWTIEIENAKELDLEKMTDIEIAWKAQAWLEQPKK